MQYIRHGRRQPVQRALDAGQNNQSNRTWVGPEPSMIKFPIAFAAGLCLCLSVAMADSRTDVGDAMPADAPELQRAEQLTLNRLLDEVLERFPVYAELPARLEEAARFDAKAGSLLSDAMSLELRYQTGRIGNNDNLKEYEAGVEFPLWRFGERRASKQVAREMELAADRFAGWVRWQLAGVLRSSLWRVELTANRVQQAEKADHISADLSNSIERQVGLGILPRSDLLQAKQDKLNSEIRLIEAQVEHANAVRAYRVITGQAVRPADIRESRSTKSGIDEQHPALAYSAAQLARANAEYRLERQSGTSNPALLLGARSERGGDDASYEDSVGISVSYPFGFGAHANAEVAAAGTRAAEARAAHRAQLQALDVAVHDAAETLAGAERELRLAREMNELAQQHLSMSLKALELGEIDLMTFLLIKESAYDAELGASEKEIAWQSAIAEFNQAVGELP